MAYFFVWPFRLESDCQPDGVLRFLTFTKFTWLFLFPLFPHRIKTLTLYNSIHTCVLHDAISVNSDANYNTSPVYFMTLNFKSVWLLLRNGTTVLSEMPHMNRLTSILKIIQLFPQINRNISKIQAERLNYLFYMICLILLITRKNDILSTLFFLQTYWIVSTTFWPLSKTSSILYLRRNVKFVYWFFPVLIERVCSCVLKSLVGREILCTVNMIRVLCICRCSLTKFENFIRHVSIVMCFYCLKNAVFLCERAP